MQQRGKRRATPFCVAKPNWPSLVLSDWRRVPNVFFWLGRRNCQRVGRPSSAAKESWPHEQFCQSAFDPAKAVVAGNSACRDVRLGSNATKAGRVRDVRLSPKSSAITDIAALRVCANSRNRGCKRSEKFCSSSNQSVSSCWLNHPALSRASHAKRHSATNYEPRSFHCS